MTRGGHPCPTVRLEIMTEKEPSADPQGPRHEWGRVGPLTLVFILALVATFGVAWVLVIVFERKQEARQAFVRVVDVDEISTDPEPWGRNWPHQFDGYKATAGDKFYGGASAMPESKLDQQP